MRRLAVVRRLRPASWRTFAGGFLLGAVAILVVGAVAVAPWLLTHRSNLPLEKQFGKYAVSVAARLHAGSTKNPVTADRRTLERGQYAYIGSCAQCHGAAGDGKNAALSASLFPPATDLTTGDAKHKSDAELFWITKNGLSFTAMPGFSDQYNDDAIWAIVAYLRALQGSQPTAASLTVPTPSADELARADPHGDAVARGAAVYFAQSCEKCHGGSGNAPGELRVRMPSTDDAYAACLIRNGPNGMPAYMSAQISDAQMADLIAFLRSVPGGNQAQGGEGRPGGSPEAGRQGERGGAPEGERQLFSSRPGAGASDCGPPPDERPGGAPRATPTP